MPRGIPRDRTTLPLTDPAIRAKAKESFKRRAVLRSIESFANADLAPLDEKIKELKAELARLENAKKIILSLRGEPELPQPSTNGSSKPATSAAPTQHVEQHGDDTEDIAEKLYRHIKIAQPCAIGQLADYFNVSRLDIQKALNNDKRFEFGHKGWILAD